MGLVNGILLSPFPGLTVNCLGVWDDDDSPHTVGLGSGSSKAVVHAAAALQLLCGMVQLD